MSGVSCMSLAEAIHNKYILPTRRKRNPYVGVEFELPIVNLAKQPVDFTVVHALTDAFIGRFGFDIIRRDDSGDIYNAQSPLSDDILSFDCSYNTLEMSFGVETDLNVIHGRFLEYYTFIQDFLRPHRHTLTGMGINPYYDINRNEPIPNGRYRMLFHHLSSYEKYGEALPFHHNPNFGLFSCASQVQLDVEEGNVAETLNTFSKLEPLKSLLFANSVWGEDHELLCGRDQFWKYSLHGLNPHNVDMYAVEFHSAHEVEEYIRTMSLYCVEREGRYINFPPMPLREYFAAETVTGEYFDGERYRDITFEPRIEDLEYLRSFKFEDLTYRGTVEFRSVCEQPVSEIMAPAAFHAGLLENLHQLTEILDKDVILYQNGYNAVELRELLNKRRLPGFIDRDRTSRLLGEILDLARDGLEKRGLNEEHFLDPLYHRAKHLYSPARQIADGLDSGVPIEYYIEEFAKPV